MSLFDLVASRDTAALQQALKDDPAATALRNSEGASALAFAAYNGNAEAIALIRAAQPKIDAYEAIILGDLTEVKAAVAAGWDANSLSPDGFTPLALAAFFGHREIFDVLLPLTKDVNARATNSQQVAALHAAAAVRSVPIVEKLLRAGADPNLQQQQGFVSLHTAAMHGDAILAGLLVLCGADSSQRDTAGKSAADHARANGHAWLAERLEKLATIPAPEKASTAE